MGTTIAEVRIRGWEALIKELGYAGATKFILLYESGEGNYTKEREEIFRDISFDEIVSEIKRKRKEK
jgi:hypothetical protein